MNNKTTFNGIAAAMLAAMACAASNVKAQTAPWPFHTQGTHVVNASGQPIRFHGMNSAGLAFGNGIAYGTTQCGGKMYGCYHPNTAAEYRNIANWGFNHVRLTLSWANIEPTAPISAARHSYNNAYLSQVDNAISYAQQAGLPVTVSFHYNNWSAAYPAGGGMPSWLYPGKPSPDAAAASFLANENGGQDGYIDMLKMVASRFSAFPNFIGIDVYNEPRFDPLHKVAMVSQLQALYARAAQAIHSVNPHLLIVLQDFVDKDPQLTALPAVPNIVYSFHSYGPWGSTGRGQSAIAHVQWATMHGVPTLVGEVGRKDNLDWQPDMAAFLAALRRVNASWDGFAYQFYTHPLFGLTGNGPLDQELLATFQSGF